MIMATRRRFLLDAGKGAALLAVLPSLQGCDAVTRSDVEDREALQRLAEVFGRDTVSILHLASFAPSGHNAQPWTVEIAPTGRWVIGSDPSRWLSAVDPDNREMLLSLGAFLENLIVAAAQHGHDVAYRVIGTRPSDSALIDLSLTEAAGGEPQDSEIRRLLGRRTVRKGLLDREISSSDLNALTGGAPAFAYIPRGTALAGSLAEATVEANRTQAARDDAQSELADWIRWSNADARRHRNGLTPASMELGGLEALYARTFHDRETVLGEDFREATIDMVASQVKQGAGWLVLSGGGSDIASMIETGRVFERMFLRARERMIAIHPMTQVLEEAPWRDQVAATLGGETPQLVLRVGYLDKYPDPVSLRMPLNAFVTQA
jgi:hypothetical protein